MPKRKRFEEVPWTPRTPSETCESQRNGDVAGGYKPCGRQAVAAYPAMGGGYHSLCAMHYPKHQNYCVTLDEARRGKVPKMMRPTGGSRDGE